MFTTMTNSRGWSRDFAGWVAGNIELHYVQEDEGCLASNGTPRPNIHVHVALHNG